MTYPIILAHGVSRFDELWNQGLQVDNTSDPALDKLHYFKGIRIMLEERGYFAHHSRVPWATRVDGRAEELRRNVLRVLAKTGARKVNIIAHSMGGLDTRHMLFNDSQRGRVHERVASLTTIGTPHAGSPFADWAIRHFGPFVPLARRMGLDLMAFRDLTTYACRRFGECPEVRAFEDRCAETIRFRTYAGRQKYWSTFGLLKPGHSIVKRREGANDGLVSVRSARWRDEFFAGVLDRTDHLNQLGWWDTAQIWAGEGPRALLRRIHEVYADIAAELPGE